MPRHTFNAKRSRPDLRGGSTVWPRPEANKSTIPQPCSRWRPATGADGALWGTSSPSGLESGRGLGERRPPTRLTAAGCSPSESARSAKTGNQSGSGRSRWAIAQMAAEAMFDPTEAEIDEVGEPKVDR